MLCNKYNISLQTNLFVFVAKNNNDAKKKKGKKTDSDEGDDSKVLQYEIFYKELRNNSMPSGGAFSFDKVSFSEIK